MKPSAWRYQFDRLRHAVRRRKLRSRIEVEYRKLLETIDPTSFRDRFRTFWDPFAGTRPAKFLDLETWFREAVFRFYLVDADRLEPGARVLDLGSGSGYFLAVCRTHGLDAMGLDLAGEPFYDEMFSFLGLPRQIHRIEPFQPLPELGRDWSLVTAFMTCFDCDERGQPWGSEEWQFLLDDLHPRIGTNGRLVMKLNLNPISGEFYPPAVERTWKQHRGYRTQRFFDYYEFRRREG